MVKVLCPGCDLPLGQDQVGRSWVRCAICGYEGVVSTWPAPSDADEEAPLGSWDDEESP
ncbi:MAG TPA: hypothetical protein VNL18_15535 [Gemmatimonadales bacterium]|nr:hypothetical protein [Gemmatimonadales bacterium]